MLLAAAVCPHPPLLVPEIAGRLPEVEPVRAGCVAAVRRLAAAGVTRLAVVGGVRAGELSATSLAPYGRETAPAPEPLPLSLLIGHWLLERAGWDGWPGGVEWQPVADDASAADCLALGRALASTGERLGLLVMGDGSAALTERSPGYLVDGAAAFDAGAVRALAAADAAALAALDVAAARRFLVAGRAPWQVLAGAAGERRFAAETHYAGAPYGVSYVVVSWLADRATPSSPILPKT